MPKPTEKLSKLSTQFTEIMARKLTVEVGGVTTAAAIFALADARDR
jgi:hypothetical protein